MDSIFEGNRSTVIKMSLNVDGRELKVSHSDRDFLLLEEPAELAPGPAVFCISVDGKQREFDLEITDASAGRKVHATRSSLARIGQPA